MGVGEKAKTSFFGKRSFRPLPEPLSHFQEKRGSLGAPVGCPGYVARVCLRRGWVFGYVARGRSADAPPWHAGRDKPLDAAREVFVLLNKRGVF